MAPSGSLRDARPPPHPWAKAGLSWVNVVSAGTPPSTVEFPPHLQKTHFDKIKASSRSLVTFDPKLWSSARDGMQSSLYAKFLRKSLHLDQAKLALADVWRGLGEFSMADLPNGYYYIRYATQDMQTNYFGKDPSWWLGVYSSFLHGKKVFNWHLKDFQLPQCGFKYITFWWSYGVVRSLNS